MNFLCYAGPQYEKRAAVLIESIKKYHPEAQIFYYKLPNNTPAGQYVPGFHVRKWEDIKRIIKYSDAPLCFIGSDCELFSRLEEIPELLKTNDCIIVPHVPDPVKNRDYMKRVHYTGHANSDFIVFNNTEEALNIAEWMCSVVKDEDVPGGFYDQTWVSSLPYLFDRVHILRDERYNMGYWRDNIYTTGLRFFHYSGFIDGVPERLSRHYHKPISDELLDFCIKYDDRIK